MRSGRNGIMSNAPRTKLRPVLSCFHPVMPYFQRLCKLCSILYTSPALYLYVIKALYIIIALRAGV